MKKILFLCLMASGMALLFNSCEKATIDSGSFSKPYDPNAAVDTVYFSTDILPILTGNCGSCHASQNPVLGASVAYSNLMNGYVDAGSPSTSELYIKLTDLNSSHISRSTAPQQELIYNWILQGALNN
jgi:hypothetical protein